MSREHHAPWDRSRFRLWKDVPTRERVTPNYLRGCRGARDPAWLAAALHNLTAPGCQMSVRMFYSDPPRYKPCALPVVPGTDFCVGHGGRQTELAQRRAWIRRMKVFARHVRRVEKERAGHRLSRPRRVRWP